MRGRKSGVLSRILSPLKLVFVKYVLYNIQPKLHFWFARYADALLHAGVHPRMVNDVGMLAKSSYAVSRMGW